MTDRRWFPELEEITRQWLFANYIPCDDLVICHGLDKPERCKDLGIDAFVEDCADNAIALAESVMGVYLAEKSWNAGRDLPTNCLRGPWDVIASDLNALVSHDLHIGLAEDALASTWLTDRVMKSLTSDNERMGVADAG